MGRQYTSEIDLASATGMLFQRCRYANFPENLLTKKIDKATNLVETLSTESRPVSRHCARSHSDRGKISPGEDRADDTFLKSSWMLQYRRNFEHVCLVTRSDFVHSPLCLCFKEAGLPRRRSAVNGKGSTTCFGISFKGILAGPDSALFIFRSSSDSIEGCVFRNEKISVTVGLGSPQA